MAGKFGITDTLKPLDELFGDSGTGGIKHIPLERLVEFSDHPFKVRDDADMAELVESVASEGVMVPLLVRPYGDDYQIIAGHRRKRAAELAGLDAVPCIVKELDDDAAIAYMVDTNLARTKILPSEKALAYKLKLDAMKRQAGRPKNGAPIGAPFQGQKSIEILAEEMSKSKDEIRRYIRLTELVPALLDRVDGDLISIRAGVELSYIEPEAQELIAQNIAEFEASQGGKPFTISIKQAEALRECGESIDEESICEILFPRTNQNRSAAPAKFKLKLDVERVRGYFDEDATPGEIEETIIRLLERWRDGEG